jgi:hypothetical protein
VARFTADFRPVFGRTKRPFFATNRKRRSFALSSVGFWLGSVCPVVVPLDSETLEAAILLGFRSFLAFDPRPSKSNGSSSVGFERTFNDLRANPTELTPCGADERLYFRTAFSSAKSPSDPRQSCAFSHLPA